LRASGALCSVPIISRAAAGSGFLNAVWGHFARFSQTLR